MPRPRPTSAVLILLIISGAAFTQFQRTRSCDVGISGTDATVTVRGWRSSALCDRLVESSSRGYYHRNAAPDGKVLCEYDDRGRHYTVRDQGVVMIVGRTVCAELANDPSSLRRSVDM